MAKIDWLTVVSAAESKADEGCRHHGWSPRGIEWTRFAASLMRAEYISLASDHNRLLERIAAGAVPAMPEGDSTMKRRSVTLHNRALDESTIFAVDFWTNLPDTTECDWHDISVSAVWSGANDVSPFLDHLVDAEIRDQLAKQLRAEAAESFAVDVATRGYQQQNNPAAELEGA